MIAIFPYSSLTASAYFSIWTSWYHFYSFSTYICHGISSATCLLLPFYLLVSFESFSGLSISRLFFFLFVCGVRKGLVTSSEAHHNNFFSTSQGFILFFILIKGICKRTASMFLSRYKTYPMPLSKWSFYSLETVPSHLSGRN